MSSFVDEVMDSVPDIPGARLTFGVATATNTVPIDGGSTSVPIPALSPVVEGQRAAILIIGSQKLILGATDQQRPPGIMLERNTLYSVSNGGGGDVIPWGSNETYLHHLPATYKGAADDTITIPVGLGGVYFVMFSGEFTANTTGIRQIWVTIGSNSATGDELGVIVKQPASGTLRDRMIASGMVYLDDGAVLTARAYQNSGGALNITDMRFQALRIH